MRPIFAIAAAALLAAPAGASAFGLAGLRAGSLEKVNPFPDPGDPDGCYLAGIKDGLCRFKCRSGETFEIKPVKPEAANVYEKCGVKVPGLPKSGSARSLAGRVSGSIGGAPVNLSFYSLEGRITGTLFGRQADLAVDGLTGSVAGSLNGSPAEMTITKGPDGETVMGSAHGRDLKYNINWKSALAEGADGGTPFLIMWEPGSLESGATVKLSGYVNRAVLELSYDRGTGRLTGEANRGRVDITLSGWDLADFIRYYFVFMKPRGS